MTLSRRAMLPLVAGAPLALSSALTGCTSAESSARAIYVLLDYSGTYFRELPRCLTALRGIVARLNPFDSMVVARIDNCSFASDSILLRVRLPDTPSAATRTKLTVGEQLDRIERTAQRTGYTDIIGALYQASTELKTVQTQNKYVILFSDLEQDLAPGCRAGRDQMPDMTGVTAVASNVIILNERRPQDYLDRIDSWEQRFRSAGAKDWRVIPNPLDVRDLFRGF